MTKSAGATAAMEVERRREAKLTLIADAKREIVRLAKYKDLRHGGAVLGLMRQAMRGEATGKTVKYLVRKGLMTWEGGRAAPKPTALGRGVMLGAEFGIRFLDVCVLAIIYRYAHALATRTSAARKHGKRGMQCASVPLPTIQNYMTDWPCNEFQICKSVTRLRAVGLLPRSPYRVIICDVWHLSGAHDRLVDLDNWVRATTNEMRLVLINAGKRDEGMRTAAGLPAPGAV